MQITLVKNGVKSDVIVESVLDKDYKAISKARYWFDWKKEKNNIVYKLRLENSEDILGLISLIKFDDEDRLEIKLLAVSKENRGKNKVYDGIAGNLIAYACREAIKFYAEAGCVSLVPKTELKPYYLKKYGMEDAGIQVFLEGKSLLRLLKKYEI